MRAVICDSCSTAVYSDSEDADDVLAEWISVIPGGVSVDNRMLDPIDLEVPFAAPDDDAELMEAMAAVVASPTAGTSERTFCSWPCLADWVSMRPELGGDS